MDVKMKWFEQYADNPTFIVFAGMMGAGLRYVVTNDKEVKVWAVVVTLATGGIVAVFMLPLLTTVLEDYFKMESANRIALAGAFLLGIVADQFIKQLSRMQIPFIKNADKKTGKE